MKINRKKTKNITIGDVKVSGNSNITVQSMTNTLTTDIEATVKQIKICVMGCIVNGLGESKKADCGVIGLDLKNSKCSLFNNGEQIKTIDNKDAAREIEKFVRSKL